MKRSPIKRTPIKRKAPRRASKQKQIDRVWLALVHEVGCVLCARLCVPQQSPTTAHHIREGQGAGQRAPDQLTVALCFTCHQGDSGIHGDRTLLRLVKCDELDLLADTIKSVHSILLKR